MRIELEPALAAHLPLLRSLLSDCLTEFEKYGGSGPDYPYFDAYWEQPDHRWPYLIRLDDRYAGFAFVNTWSPSGRGTDFAIAEFYVVPDARGRGVGFEAAKTILNERPGQWELSVMARNAPAQKFWPRIIDAIGAGDVERIVSDETTIYCFTIG
ncbi:GNAT family N-acetyltransferase [Rhizobium sp. XQZ8]|uniref:GNAT family N-acetyltransferase n=1 Tax=Rhizobium populisoli TaxID=2859785 RepID=UPI001CA4B90D|nr:GNAT family N-acetyltransferase [Rhizobium populisoli]MBW6420408.1 GNAT family N-acetyltransferase [Rhizobium populisoli]